MKLSGFCLLIPLFLALSCKSDPPVKVEAPAPVPIPVTVTEAVPVEPVKQEEEVFDPSTITQEVYDNTKAEVQAFIGNLNKIIKAKDYNGWVKNLGDAYFAEKNNPEYLRQISEQPRLRTSGIVLTNAYDYFIHVVVPSRANARADDIEFETQKRVKAYQISSKGQRLRLYELEMLYDLENIDGSWKIIN